MIVDSRQGPWVRLKAVSATGCARCDAGEGCGGGLFAKLVRDGHQGLSLEDQAGDLKPGEHVVVGLEEGVFLRATLLTYAWPLLILLCLALAGGVLAWPDAWVATAALSGFALASGSVPWLRRRYLDRHLHPRVLRRVHPEQWLCQND